MERCRSFPGEAIGAIATKATWYIQSAWLGYVRLALLRLDLVEVLAWFMPLVNLKVVVKSDNLTIFSGSDFPWKKVSFALPEIFSGDFFQRKSTSCELGKSNFSPFHCTKRCVLTLVLLNKGATYDTSPNYHLFHAVSYSSTKPVLQNDIIVDARTHIRR